MDVIAAGTCKETTEMMIVAVKATWRECGMPRVDIIILFVYFLFFLTGPAVIKA